ncbi:MAG TPA: aminotransferase class I/II-fold pyridoxal phosphate-dependent enzyme [Solirubrobacteraceae bacterium]|jgi:cystathionine beta-lyase
MSGALTALTIEELRARRSTKWRHFGPDVLPLWVAEMDVALAPPVAAALHEAVERGDTGYPELDDYAGAMAAFARRRWGWNADAAAMAPVADVMRGIVEVLALLTSPGDCVVVNSPVYFPFYAFIAHSGRRVVEAPLGPDHRIDAAALDSALAQAGAGGGRAALLLCNPHNPTGTVHTRDELETAGALAFEHGVRVVVDEIHAPLVYEGHVHVPYLSLAVGANAFTLLSASKGWNLAGIKAALAAAGPDAVDELATIPDAVRHGASHLGVISHVAALELGEPWLDALIPELDANRRLLGELLAKHLPEARYSAPEGTYLAWIDCRALGLGDDPAAAFLERAGVALSAGPAFGTGGAGHARMNLATSPQIVSEAVERMAAAV